MGSLPPDFGWVVGCLLVRLELPVRAVSRKVRADGWFKERFGLISGKSVGSTCL